MLDPAGVTRTKALGSDRIARKLHDTVPGGEGAPARRRVGADAIILSPALIELHRDAFAIDHGVESTVDLEAHRTASDLDDLALDHQPEAEAA